MDNMKHNTHQDCLSISGVLVILRILAIDDFGIKYIGKEHVDNLINKLKDEYTNTLKLTR